MHALLVSLLVTLAPATPITAANAPSAADAVCQLERDAAHAFVAKDAAFLEGLFADDFEHINFRGGVANKHDEIAFFTSPELRMQSATIDSCTARVYDRVAVATGVTTWTGVIARGTDLSGAYRYTRVYHEQHGRWQIVASHFSKIPSAS